MTERTFWGHPAGLATLFFTEMWERFSYYGMRGLLILYMTAPRAAGGLGYDTARAGAIYGLYVGSVYLVCLPGGWLADRFLGTRRATAGGGALILAGHVCLAVPLADTFWVGLGLVVGGTGLLKPSISSLVGELYAAGDVRRDAGYSLYYMGINLGALLAPLVCGWLALSEAARGWLRALGLAPELAWHWGFGAAALGMACGLLQFMRGGARLPVAALKPQRPADASARYRLYYGLGGALLVGAAVLLAASGEWLSVSGLSNAFGGLLLVVAAGFFLTVLRASHWTRQERGQLGVIVLLFVAASVFWSLFEQAGSTLTLFAARNTNLQWGQEAFPATYFLALNPLLIILLSPLFAWGWTRLGARNPASMVKFTLGLVLVAAGFGVLILAAQLAATGVKVSPWWLCATYFLHTLGELCLSPVGLSAISRLAPAQIASLTMGVWFLASAVGNYLGGRAASLYDTFALPSLFGAVAGLALLAAVVLAAFIPYAGQLLARPAAPPGVSP